MGNQRQKGKALLLQQFASSTALNCLLGAFLNQLDEISDQINRISDGKWTAIAEGNNLDVLGRIVGQPRDGLNDEMFFLWIKARILINRSSGTADEMIAILRLLLEENVEVTIKEDGKEYAEIFFKKAIAPEKMKKIFRLLLSAKPLGARLQIVYSHPVPGAWNTVLKEEDVLDKEKSSEET